MINILGGEKGGQNANEIVCVMNINEAVRKMNINETYVNLVPKAFSMNLVSFFTNCNRSLENPFISTKLFAYNTHKHAIKSLKVLNRALHYTTFTVQNIKTVFGT